MARIREIVDVAAPPRTAFDLVADFSRTAEWDPGVADAVALDADAADGAVGLGKRFRLELDLVGRRVPFVYTTTAFVDGEHVTHETRKGVLRGADRVTITGHDGGSRITWEAEFGVAGIGRMLDPLLQPGFQRVARKAVAGLRSALSADANAGR